MRSSRSAPRSWTARPPGDARAADGRADDRLAGDVRAGDRLAGGRGHRLRWNRQPLVLVRRLDRQVRKPTIDPARQPPVRPPQQVHECWYQDRAEDERVDEDRAREADAELRHDPLATEHEREEHQDHDRRGGRNHPAGRGLTSRYRTAVVARVYPLLVHPTDEEHL